VSPHQPLARSGTQPVRRSVPDGPLHDLRHRPALPAAV